MKTIEVQGKNLKIQKRRAKKLIKLLPKNVYFHFLFEPELIIRLENENTKYITDYLKKRKIGYKIYPYPFTKKGFGEARKGIMHEYLHYFKPLMNIQSKIAINSKTNHRLRIIERYNHTFLNSLGYEWIDESIIYAWLAGGRIAVFKRYNFQTPASFLVCTIIIMLMKFNIFLMRLIK